MNFFRSEEHLHHWEGYQEKGKGGMITLNALMELFSGPYFKNRSSPDWVSNMGRYTAIMIATLDRLHGAGNHWQLSPLEKFGLSIAKKLGMM